MAGWNDEEQKAEGRRRKAEGRVPMWVQWSVLLAALGLGAWFGWISF